MREPLHKVLHWMEAADVDEGSSVLRGPGPCLPSNAAAADLLLGRPVSCLGSGPRAGDELSLASESEESFPDVPSEVQEIQEEKAADATEREQSGLGVPNEDLRPRPPPYSSHIALVRWPGAGRLALRREAESRRGQAAASASSSSVQCAPQKSATATDREEEEWMARKKLTGAIGRMVQYREGQHPADDILGLCRTGYGRIKVTSLRMNGIASSAGVEIGDQLISINGEQPSDRLSVDSLRATLSSPATLIFMGFAGKLQAEVRVRQPDEPRCGLPPFADVATAATDNLVGSRVELCETVVFHQQPVTSLLLQVDGAQATEPPPGDPPTMSRQLAMHLPASRPAALLPSSLPQAPPEAGTGRETDPLRSSVYELQREEAKRLLRRALRAGIALGVDS